MTFCSLVMKKNVHAQSSALVLSSSENRRNEVLFLILNGTRKKNACIKIHVAFIPVLRGYS